MSAANATETSPIEHAEDDFVELHVRNVPRSIWLKARQSALVSRLRFGQYVIKLLEQAEPMTPVRGQAAPPLRPKEHTAPHRNSSDAGFESLTPQL